MKKIISRTNSTNIWLIDIFEYLNLFSLPIFCKWNLIKKFAHFTIFHWCFELRKLVIYPHSIYGLQSPRSAIFEAQVLTQPWHRTYRRQYSWHCPLNRKKIKLPDWTKSVSLHMEVEEIKILQKSSSSLACWAMSRSYSIWYMYMTFNRSNQRQSLDETNVSWQIHVSD